MVYREDIKEILERLLHTLQATEDYSGITELTYNAAEHVVLIKAPEGYFTVPVSTDSGSRIIMDVVTALWAYY